MPAPEDPPANPAAGTPPPPSTEPVRETSPSPISSNHQHKQQQQKQEQEQPQQEQPREQPQQEQPQKEEEKEEGTLIPASTPRQAFVAGFAACAPLMLGVAPFGVIYGAAARDAGLSLIQTMGMSLTVFAGASQFIFVNLWHTGAALLVLVLTCLAVNLRMLIYGATMARELKPSKSAGETLARSYLLTDESFAVSIVNFHKKGFRHRRVPFYLGSGLPTWVSWQAAGVFGYLAGSVIPESWPISLAVPLIFISLLVAILRAGNSARPPKYVSAVVAGLAALVFRDLPYNLGLIIATGLGVFLGAVAGSRNAAGSEREAGR
ncbi:MAG: AzlC family ABC transporter permease [Deltaproteobacteria bacterium]|nr:AzlC family ABC transporter permease [Deltaproteobacteria bacterium]